MRSFNSCDLDSSSNMSVRWPSEPNLRSGIVPATRIVINGPPQSGKTTFCKNLIRSENAPLWDWRIIMHGHTCTTPEYDEFTGKYRTLVLQWPCWDSIQQSEATEIEKILPPKREENARNRLLLWVDNLPDHHDQWKFLQRMVYRQLVRRGYTVDLVITGWFHSALSAAHTIRPSCWFEHQGDFHFA